MVTRRANFGSPLSRIEKFHEIWWREISQHFIELLKPPRADTKVYETSRIFIFKYWQIIGKVTFFMYFDAWNNNEISFNSICKTKILKETL